MTRKSLVIGAGLAALLVAGAVSLTSPSTAQPYGGGGWGMMGGYGQGGYGGGGYGPRGGPGFDCPRFRDGGGPGWGRGGGYGPGWMHGDRGYGPGYGRGYGRGWMGGPGGPGGSAGDLKLSADDVKTRLERWLEWRGNARLKVGDVKEKDADTIVADVVTKDNSLVQRYVVNRHTGAWDRSGE